MTAAYPEIRRDLARLEADVARPVFVHGETVRAVLNPENMVTGTVASYHDFSGLLTIHPHGLGEHPFSTIDVYVRDGWAVEHVVEVP